MAVRWDPPPHEAVSSPALGLYKLTPVNDLAAGWRVQQCDKGCEFPPSSEIL